MLLDSEHSEECTYWFYNDECFFFVFVNFSTIKLILIKNQQESSWNFLKNERKTEICAKLLSYL